MANPFGAAPGIIVGVGVGTAAAAAIEPAIELPKQQAWAAAPNRVLDPSLMARLVASGGVDIGIAHTDAALEGYSPDKLDALVYLAQTVPGFAEAITALRRGTISPADFAHTLVKTAMDARYYTAIEDLQNVWLSPPQVALSIVRSLLKDPGLMPVQLDTSGGVIPAYPQSNIDPLKEALGGGIDTERLRVLVGSIGLPMSTQQAANATFRGIINRGDFNRSILEGDVRPEYADAIFEQAREYPTAHDYVELHLRNYTDQAGMYAGTAKHGMSQADTDILFNVTGRPLSFHQVFIGLARGGTLGGPITGIDPAFLDSLRKSNIRPEYYNLAWAQRYTYPTAFVLRALAQGGDLTQAQTEQILLYEGWEPTLAASVSAKWTGGTGTGGAVKKDTVTLLTQEYLAGVLSQAALTAALTGMGYTAQQAADMIANINFKAASTERTRATRALEKRFVGTAITETEARAQLALIGWPQGVIDSKIAAWYAERDEILTTLSAAQVVKAYKKSTIDQATALQLLEDLGHSPADAQTLLTDA